MGTHGSGRTRQLFSRPLLAGLLGIILVVALIVAWNQYGDRIDDGSTKAASCLSGDAHLPIAADPAVAPALQEIATTFNAARPVIRDYCVSVDVRPVDAGAMLEGLTAPKWDAQAHGLYPAAWVPESSVWSAALATANPSLLAGTPDSLVSSPIRLAMEPELAREAKGKIAWGDLPSLTRDNALRAFGHSSWGSLRMAMPTGAESDATALAAQAVAAVTAEATGPLTAAQARSEPVVAAMHELMSAPPRVGDGTAEAAVRAIADTRDPADAKVRAVPISEQRLYLLTKGDAKAKVAVVAPSGPTPVADYPVIMLGGDGVSDAMAAAAAEFFTFARKPEEMKILTQTGFRGPGPLPAGTATVTFGEVGTALPVPEPAATVDLNRIILPSAVPGR